ncbi:MAG: hypothetical protein IPH35_09240 [Rhodoferax sp.]|nr:hypothetical protein [Rhodoferax sp.]
MGCPDLLIQGNGSDAWHLHWYEDRVRDSTTAAWVVSVPVLAYRVAMPVWALWLAGAGALLRNPDPHQPVATTIGRPFSFSSLNINPVQPGSTRKGCQPHKQFPSGHTQIGALEAVGRLQNIAIFSHCSMDMTKPIPSTERNL